jgi:hypothetical protein
VTYLSLRRWSMVRPAWKQVRIARRFLLQVLNWCRPR